MTSKLLQVFVTQFLFLRTISCYNVQPYSPRQYGPAPRPSPQSRPSYTSPSYSSPAYSSDYKAYFSQNYPTSYYHSYPKTPESIAVQPPRQEFTRNPVLETTLVTSAPAPKLEPLKQCSGKIDSQVLNNLAIALQLLIVNNILNNPPESLEVSPVAETILNMVLPGGSHVNSFETLQVPSSKFLGSSSFGQDISSSILGSYGISSNPPSSRAGLNLMSPYDAIAKSAPISETLLSSFVTKNDFQSPYAALMAADSNKDLFSMSDLFS